MSTFRSFLFISTILLSIHASSADHYNREHDGCPTIIITATTTTRDVATIYVTISPTVTIVNSVCDWRSTSLVSTPSSSSPASATLSTSSSAPSTAMTSGLSSLRSSNSVPQTSSTSSISSSMTSKSLSIAAPSFTSQSPSPSSAPPPGTPSSTTQSSSSTLIASISSSADNLPSWIASWTAQSSKSSTPLFAPPSSTGSVFSSSTSSSAIQSPSDSAEETATTSSIINSSSSSTSAAVTTVPQILLTTLLTTIIDGVTSTSTQIDEIFVTSTATSTIENFVSSTSTIDALVTSTINVQVDVTSTVYNTAPECSIISTISNSNFDDPLTDNAWDEAIASGSGFDISTDTNNVASSDFGPNRVKFSFPAGSTESDVLSISQTITVCPDQFYDFNAFALPDPGNTGYCEAWFSTTPESGTDKTGNEVILVAGSNIPVAWNAIDITQNNAALNSTSITLFLNAVCISSSASYVYLDTVTVRQS